LFLYTKALNIRGFLVKYILKDYSMLLYLQSLNGGLAQLARALAWHARGRRFDPDTLHKNHIPLPVGFFVAAGYPKTEILLNAYITV
jgi:hypothetical protein